MKVQCIICKRWANEKELHVKIRNWNNQAKIET